MKFLSIKNLRGARRRGPVTRAPARITLALIGSAMGLAWFSGFYFLWVVKNSKERDLEKRLISVGEVAADYLAENHLPTLFVLSAAVDAYSTNPTAEPLEAREQIQRDSELPVFLRSLVTKTEVRRAMLVDVDKRAVADSSGETIPFEPFEDLGIDTVEMEAAAKTRETKSNLSYNLRGQPFKRSYTPISDGEGTVFAFLRLEAGADYFSEIQKIRRIFFTLGLVGTALLVGVGFIYLRLLRHVQIAEGNMAHAQRLDSVARLAAGFAHEIRNPLGIIRSNAEWLAEEFEEKQDADGASMARDMVEEVERLNSLVTRFLQFSRPGDMGAYAEVDVREELRQVVSLAHKELEASGAVVELDLDQPAPLLRADARLLRQVFLNVLLNARDALEGGGKIRIQARESRGQAVVTVEDNGTGISEEDLKRVFDPFFTTKPEGAGLGLAVSLGIVEQFGGAMKIQSREGKGTTVEMTFPAAV